VYESFSTDARLSEEMRGIEEQIALELGQWQEPIEVEDVSLADTLAKAPQTKPRPQAEPLPVVEQRIAAPCHVSSDFTLRALTRWRPLRLHSHRPSI
jgi:hypothetical protein